MADQWYYRLFGEEHGPVTRDVLTRSIAFGELSEDDEIRVSGEASWSTVGEFVARGLANGHESAQQIPAMSLDFSALDDADPDRPPRRTHARR